MQRFSSAGCDLKRARTSTSVGDEGGFAPALKSDEEAIETILEAVKKAGYEPGSDFRIAMDAASSEWKTGKVGEYKLPEGGNCLHIRAAHRALEEACGEVSDRFY